MKKALFAIVTASLMILVVFGSMPASAGYGSIQVTINGEYNPEGPTEIAYMPLSGVTVSIKNKNGYEVFSGTTDSNGHCSVGDLDLWKEYTVTHSSTTQKSEIDGNDYKFSGGSKEIKAGLGLVAGPVTFNPTGKRCDSLDVDEQVYEGTDTLLEQIQYALENAGIFVKAFLSILYNLGCIVLPF